jgi:Actinobacteria/chloroflexi VLRF1 release factor
VLLPVAAGLDAIVTGGDRAAVAAVLADPRLAALPALAAKCPTRPLAVPDPRLAVLRATPEQFLAVRIAIHP